MTFLDKTFCVSPNCENECGRKMTVDEKAALKIWQSLINPANDPKVITPITYGYFCGEPKIKPILDSSSEPQA